MAIVFLLLRLFTFAFVHNIPKSRVSLIAVPGDGQTTDRISSKTQSQNLTGKWAMIRKFWKNSGGDCSRAVVVLVTWRHAKHANPQSVQCSPLQFINYKFQQNYLFATIKIQFRVLSTDIIRTWAARHRYEYMRRPHMNAHELPTSIAGLCLFLWTN